MPMGRGIYTSATCQTPVATGGPGAVRSSLRQQHQRDRVPTQRRDPAVRTRSQDHDPDLGLLQSKLHPVGCACSDGEVFI